MDPSNTPSSGKKRKGTEMELLSGKLLVDTYSKRSRTLIEKGKELEKLTGAYVAIYTARPESILSKNHRKFISDNLQNTDPILTTRICGALNEIDATAIEVTRFSQPAAPSRKKARTSTSDQSSATAPPASQSPNSEINVYAQGVEYENALGAASSRGQETVVRLLLDHGADVNAEWGAYGTALYAASKQGHKDVVSLLLAREADVDTVMSSGRTALDAASSEGHEAIVRMLLASGADINSEYECRSALVEASFKGHEEIVKLLLDSGADVNAVDFDGRTALEAASSKGCETIMRLLLTRAVDINWENHTSALVEASAKGHEEIRKDSGADVNAGDTALGTASSEDHETIARLLPTSGADIDRGNRGSPLVGASVNGHEGTANLLLENGTDINAKGVFDFLSEWPSRATALHAAFTSFIAPLAPPPSQDSASSWRTSPSRLASIDRTYIHPPHIGTMVPSADESPALPKSSHLVDWLDHTMKRPISFVAEKMCEMLCYLWFATSLPAPTVQRPLARHNHSPPYSPKTNRAATALQLVASPNFVTFMQKVLETTQVGHSVIVLSLHYIYRLKERNCVTTAKSGSEFRIAVAALMMANTFLGDNTYTNKMWSDASGIELEEISRMEREFLLGIDFNLYIDQDTYESWRDLLKGLAMEKERDRRLWHKPARSQHRSSVRPSHPSSAAPSTRSYSTRYRTTSHSTSPSESRSFTYAFEFTAADYSSNSTDQPSLD